MRREHSITGDARRGRTRRLRWRGLVRMYAPMAVLGAIGAGCLVGPAAGNPAGKAEPIYLNRSYSFAERAADLVSRMTLTRRPAR